MRSALKNDVPEHWRERQKAGLCPVCAKTPAEFDKGQRIFCSIKCREEYSKKYIFWSELRDRILERDKHTCKKCGATKDKYREECEKLKKERILNWTKNNPELIKTRRDEMLVRLDRRFMDEFNDIMNDYWIADRTLSWEEQREITGKLPREPNMDVDHITPVAQGGDMWEESNLQCLCTECHREKTNNDLKFIKKYKKGDGDVGNFLKKEEKK